MGLLAFVPFAIAFSHIGYPAMPSNIGFMILIYLFSLTVYCAGKYYRKSKGIDMELAFDQIPPEQDRIHAGSVTVPAFQLSLITGQDFCKISSILLGAVVPTELY